MRAGAVLGGACALAGCYEIAGVEPAEVIEVSVTPQTAPADGTTVVEIAISLDADAAIGNAITVRTSAGVLSFAAAGEAAQTITLKVPRSKDLDRDARKTATTPLRVARTAGATVISATVGEVSATAILALEPRLPASMFSESAVSALTADGAARAELGVFLLAEPPASVSLGTRVASRVCCVDGATGQPAACQAPPPLRVTPLAELSAGNRVTVTAVTEPMTGSAELGVWVVSAIPSAPVAEAPCAAPDGVTSSAVRLTLRPNP